MAASGSLRDQLRDQSGSYLPRLVAVFYAVFDEKQGPKIVCQVPEGSVATALSTFPGQSIAERVTEIREESRATSQGMVRSTSQPAVSSTKVLFDFSSILDFVIPKPELCGHLVTKATRTSKILGFPVRIYNEEKYHKGKENYNRNAFLFNLCFVFERDAELSCFEPVVRKSGRYLQMMENSVSLLSSPPPSFQIDHLVEQIYMDLNAFSEASITLHDSYLDLFVLPFYANPREIKLWDVPIAVSPLQDQKNASWDVTLFKLCSYIDGVNHVKRISELAEVDQTLARLCIQHLLFYSSIILVDLFQFSNSYAILPGITDIVQYGEEEDEGVTDLRAECEAYVYNGTGDVPPLPFATLLSFYAKLTPGLSVSAWMDNNDIDTFPIDVRRMIQFGVIKGFLRRVYAYPVWLDHPSFSPGPRKPHGRRTFHRPATAPASESDASFPPNAASSNFSMRSSGTGMSALAPTPPPRTPTDAPAAPQERTALLGTKMVQEEHLEPEPLKPLYPSGLPHMLDGKHHTDEIGLKYGVSFKVLESLLRAIGGDDDGLGMATPAEEEMGRPSGSGSYGRVTMLYV